MVLEEQRGGPDQVVRSPAFFTGRRVARNPPGGGCSDADAVNIMAASTISWEADMFSAVDSTTPIPRWRSIPYLALVRWTLYAAALALAFAGLRWKAQSVPDIPVRKAFPPQGRNYADTIRAAGLLVREDHPIRLYDESEAATRDSVAANRLPLQIYHQFRTSPRFYAPALGWKDKFDLHIPEVTLARIAAAEARLAYFDGDHQGAARMLLDLYRFGQGFSRSGTIIEGLVALLIQQIALQELGPVVETGDEAALRVVRDGLAKAAAHNEPFRDVLRRERAAVLYRLQEWGRGEGYPDVGGSGAYGRLCQYTAIMSYQLNKRRELEHHNRLWDAIEQRATEPPSRRQALPSAAHDSVCGLIQPVFSTTFDSSDTVDALTSVLITRASVRLFSLKNGGRLPATLAEADVPGDWEIDPYSGKPLAYRRTPLNGSRLGFAVYSVGKNRIDDGGDTFRRDLTGLATWTARQRAKTANADRRAG
jgi:hypothetical protein